MNKLLALVSAAALTALRVAGCAAPPQTIDVAPAEVDLEDITAEGVEAGVEALPFEQMEPDELFELMGELYPLLDAMCETMERGYFGAFEPTDPSFVWDTVRTLYRRDGSAEVSADGSEDVIPGDYLESLCAACFNGAALPALPEGYPAAYDETADTYTFTNNPDIDISTDIIRVEQQDDGAAVLDVALLGRPDEKEFIDSFRFLLTPSDDGVYPYAVTKAFECYTDVVAVKEVRDTDEGYLFVVDYVDYLSTLSPDYVEGDPEGLMWDRRIENPEEEGVELLLSQYSTVDGTGLAGLLGDTDADVEECVDDVCEPGDSAYLIKNCTRTSPDGQPLYFAIKAYNGQIYDMSLLFDWYFAS